MLLVGELEYIPDIPLHILNLSSYKEGIEKLNLLPPTNGTLPFKDEKEFDIAYANYIMSNDFTFMELMKIIIPIYEGKDVYIVVSRSPYFDMITESLTKFIQVRYSIISQYVYDFNDLEFIDMDLSFANIQGLYNLDVDKERFSRLIAPTLIQKDGEIQYDGYK